MSSGTVLASGKQKVIERTADDGIVKVSFGDDITAGDGERHDVIPGIGVDCLKTTVNCLRLIGRFGVPTHFVDFVDNRCFLARRLDMIPVEAVVRFRSAGGAFPVRSGIPKGVELATPLFELFLKDDARHDPFLVCDAAGDRWFLYRAKEALASGFVAELAEIRAGRWRVNAADVLEMRTHAVKAARILRAAWAKRSIELVDVKFEFGYATRDDGARTILLGDDVTNGSWRIWPNGQEARQLDKQVYRAAKQVTTELLQEVARNYRMVANFTNAFSLIT